MPAKSSITNPMSVADSLWESPSHPATPTWIIEFSVIHVHFEKLSWLRRPHNPRIASATKLIQPGVAQTMHSRPTFDFFLEDLVTVDIYRTQTIRRVWMSDVKFNFRHFEPNPLPWISL